MQPLKHELTMHFQGLISIKTKQDISQGIGMKSTLEPEDLQGIAGAVADILKPLLSNSKAEADTIFTPETLAEYLQVDTSWVYKQVSYKAIPYFKTGKYTRFKKSFIDKWIETQAVRPIPPLRVIRTGR